MARKYPSGVANATSIPKFTTWKQQNRVFDVVAAYDFAGPGLNLVAVTCPSRSKAFTSARNFRGFWHGAGSGPRVCRRGPARRPAPLAVLSHGLWKRRYGGDPSSDRPAGESQWRPVHRDRRACANFRLSPADVFIPLQADPNSTNQGHFLSCRRHVSNPVSASGPHRPK
jgi:hypothetical protein